MRYIPTLKSMRRLTGYSLGRRSLCLDAAYCAILGAAVVIFAQQIADCIMLPLPLIATAGVAVVAWAGAVLWMLFRLPLGVALRCVMVINVFAVVALSSISVAAASAVAVFAIIAVAIEVSLFAVSQAIALSILARHS